MNVLITVYAVFDQMQQWRHLQWYKRFLFYRKADLLNFLWLTLFNRSWWVEFGFFDPSHRCVKRGGQQLSTLHIEDQLLCRATYTCAHHSQCTWLNIEDITHKTRMCLCVTELYLTSTHGSAGWFGRPPSSALRMKHQVPYSFQSHCPLFQRPLWCSGQRLK